MRVDKNTSQFVCVRAQRVRKTNCKPNSKNGSPFFEITFVALPKSPSTCVRWAGSSRQSNGGAGLESVSLDDGAELELGSVVKVKLTQVLLGGNASLVQVAEFRLGELRFANVLVAKLDSLITVFFATPAVSSRARSALASTVWRLSPSRTLRSSRSTPSSTCSSSAARFPVPRAARSC